MDQNEPAGSPENDLQKAIDNITNSNNASEQTFSDPVAAPSSIPDGDNGELSEPVGPFPMPSTDSTVGIVTKDEAPMASIEPLSLPNLDLPGDENSEAKIVPKPGNSSPDALNNPGPAVSPLAPTQSPASNTNTNPANPSPNPSSEASSGPDTNSAPTISPETITPGSSSTFGAPSSENSDQSDSTPPPNPLSSSPSPFGSSSDSPNLADNPDAVEIRKEILRALSPVIENTKADSSQKFRVYYETIKDLNDYSVLDKAYQAASSIQDEDERAESLLSLLESIDSM